MIIGKKKIGKKSRTKYDNNFHNNTMLYIYLLCTRLSSYGKLRGRKANK